jgi:membrane protein DedA with SNARE-associated domain
MIDAVIHLPGWVLFFWVFANQGGVPIPVVPSLVAAGALASTGGPKFVTTLAAAVVAAVCADMVWYGLGRWRGAQALRVLWRASDPLRPGADARHSFPEHEVGFQFLARFLPELNPIAAGLAGATGVAIGRCVAMSGVSAVAWAGGWTTAGYLLPSVLHHVPMYVSVPLAVFVALPLAVLVVTRYARQLRASNAPPRAL